MGQHMKTSVDRKSDSNKAEDHRFNISAMLKKLRFGSGKCDYSRFGLWLYIRHIILAVCFKCPVRLINFFITKFVGKFVNIVLIASIKFNILLGIEFP